jgi:signal transduction histidine kinase
MHASFALPPPAMVSLMVAKEHVVLSRNDTGVGFDTTQMRRKKGIGITGIEERVRLVVGELASRSRTGDGTRVVVKLRPLRLGRKHEADSDLDGG